MDPVCTEAEQLRYTHTAFPAYRYLPFQPGLPHPSRDPTGHSYAVEEEYLPSFDASEWKHCHPYLYGVDLFNHGYWWEAHEAWERVWLAAGQETPTGAFIQGLIQIAAAQLKRFIGQERGARTLTSSGVARLSIGEKVFLGIEVVLLVEEVERCLLEDCGNFPRIRLFLQP